VKKATMILQIKDAQRQIRVMIIKSNTYEGYDVVIAHARQHYHTI
jgi:hypothetical protein